MNFKTDIAIIGMSGIFPGAANTDIFWKNIIEKVDSTTVVPTDRIEAIHFNEVEKSVDRFYCNRGGFVSPIDFSPIQFGILPLAAEGTEPEHLLALQLAHTALTDAGALAKKTDFNKTGIIIGKGNYAGPGILRTIEIVRTASQIASLLRTLLPHLHEDEIDLVKKEFQQKKGRYGADTAMGLIPNLIASLVANRFNFGGPAYTVDAACASSLLAIDHAVQELHSGRCNLVLAGGVHLTHNAPFWSIFTQLGALSKTGKIMPFDKKADGLIIGEGCGFVVLKKLSDALKDDDKVYAIIKGTGISSDGSGTSILSPNSTGQIKAIKQAWQKANLPFDKIGYIEAHGTATPLGDKTELETLAKVFGKDVKKTRVGIGSVKGNIGHAMPAAGIAGVIKTALALHHGIIPPTLHCTEPHAIFANTRFEPQQHATDWDSAELPKIAGVNAFGFGGINAHVVLQGFQEKGKIKAITLSTKQPTIFVKDEVLILARATKEALLNAIEKKETHKGKGNYRVAIFNPTAERLQKAMRIIAKNIPWKNKQDIWYTNNPLLLNGGKIAFVFPGMDGLATGEVVTLAQHFKIPITNSKHTAKGLLANGLRLVESSLIIDKSLKQMGICPAINAGHSMGEWLAARASHLATEASVVGLLQFLKPAFFTKKNAKFIAVGCSIQKIKPMVKKIKGIYLSNDNCPQQVILCGTKTAIEILIEHLKKEQIFYNILPFQSGFHTPFIQKNLKNLEQGINMINFKEPTIPLWSASTLKPYPKRQKAIKQLCVQHLIKPVLFRQLTEKLYENGARVFIQIGSGGLLGFIDDTLKEKTISTIHTSNTNRSGILQMQRVVAALFVEGNEEAVSFIETTQNRQHGDKDIALQFSLPLITQLQTIQNLSHQINTKAQKELSLQDLADPVLKAFQNNFDDIIDIRNEVLGVYQLYKKSKIHTVTEQIKLPIEIPLHISIETHPYLIDHSVIRQKNSWPCIADRDPVIPMTMIFELFADAAQAASIQSRVKKIENIQALQWLRVSQPFTETIKGTWQTESKIFFTIDNYASAEVEMGSTVSPPILFDEEIGNEIKANITIEQLYAENMFHGPAYQGIKAINKIGESGISGTIEAAAGKGSLLDNAGQLFGLWLQLILIKDNIAFPIKINSIEFFDDYTNQTGTFDCTCVLTELNADFATANIILRKNNTIWCSIIGWQNRRIEIDETLFSVYMRPLKNGLSTLLSYNVHVFEDTYKRVATWDYIIKRYFNQHEKQHYNGLSLHKKKEWLLSRVAAKDAVRNILIQENKEWIYPIEFEIKTRATGQPYPSGKVVDSIQISIAHKKGIGVAMATLDGNVGIDIESIELRTDDFEELVFTEKEIAFLNTIPNRAEWQTRFWVAKEAYGKKLAKGLKGMPKAYEVSKISCENCYIQQHIIKTIKHKNYIIGWIIPTQHS